MNSVLAFEDRVLFSPTIPNEVNLLLQVAVASSSRNHSRAETLFLQAYSLDSSCLQTYFARYKFYFFIKRLHDAEKIVVAGLKESARQGGFSADYQQLVKDLLAWNEYPEEQTLFYLYTLKALAFIKLRLGDEQDARSILCHLQQLDPKDLSGASVIIALAEGVIE